MDIVASPTSTGAHEASQLDKSVADELGLHTSNDVAVTETVENEPAELKRPPLLKHVSNPAYNSPLRHHRRYPSTPRQVKESLDARSEYITSQDDGAAIHRINQYIIKQEIGRGSFGAVHLAVDQFGQEYAVKEFSKARLRKRAQSHILRKPLAQKRRGGLGGFNSPLHRLGLDEQQVEQEKESAIGLIKEEIAIMKKLNHTNLVSLIEVLDDPSEDSLYMVMEMCKKGVVMKVDLENRADPYPEEQCRTWFRDLILGIEYLHAQGVVHRDIKPDNCLITDDDVLKIVDFGVSEMFEKNSEMKTAKSAGSPAFLPPELCVAKHGDVSGKAADVWSMGVTLYCLKFGRIPFERDQILELYQSIQTDEPNLGQETDAEFCDLMRRILEKNPANRITMRDLREHSWVTKNGTDPLLSEEDNTEFVIEPPTEAEMAHAITGNMRSLMTVVKAVKKFKALTAEKRPPQMASILGDRSEARFTLPPHSLRGDLATPSLEHRSQSMDANDRSRIETALVTEGVHRDISSKYEDVSHANSEGPSRSGNQQLRSTDTIQTLSRQATTRSEEELVRLTRQESQIVSESQPLPAFRPALPHGRTTDDIGRRGHAHDPLEDQLYLYIGPSTFSGTSTTQGGASGLTQVDEEEVPIVSESPGAADVDIYETAYRDEIERILARAKEEEKEPQVYLTRRVDAKLMAISGLAGRWMAAGEEAKNQFKDYTQFSARKARVTEVSRALREVAKQEYEKRKQERKEMYEMSRAEKIKAQTGDVVNHALDKTAANIPSAVPEIFSSPTTGEAGQSTSDAWKGKAVDRGKQAHASLMGFVDMVKAKSRAKAQGDAR